MHFLFFSLYFYYIFFFIKKTLPPPPPLSITSVRKGCLPCQNVPKIWGKINQSHFFKIVCLRLAFGQRPSAEGSKGPRYLRRGQRPAFGLWPQAVAFGGGTRRERVTFGGWRWPRNKPYTRPPPRVWSRPLAEGNLRRTRPSADD